CGLEYIRVLFRSLQTLAKTGYIITSRPMAIGREIPPILIASSAVFNPGTNRPRARPMPMASKIHTASHRSKKDISLITGDPVVAAAFTPLLIQLPNLPYG